MPFAKTMCPPDQPWLLAAAVEAIHPCIRVDGLVVSWISHQPLPTPSLRSQPTLRLLPKLDLRQAGGTHSHKQRAVISSIAPIQVAVPGTMRVSGHSSLLPLHNRPNLCMATHLSNPHTPAMLATSKHYSHSSRSNRHTLIRSSSSSSSNSSNSNNRVGH